MNLEKYWLSDGDIYELHLDTEGSKIKCEYLLSSNEKLPKPPQNDKEINSFSQYYKLKQYKYTKKDLTDLCKLLKLKISGVSKMRRDNFCDYVFNYMRLCHYAKVIQKKWNNTFIKLYNNLLGPCYMNFECSNNVEDFLTTENIKDIPYEFFISYKDVDGFNYSFNLLSIYNLLRKNMNYNPYNRNVFSNEIRNILNRKIRMNTIIIKKHPNLNIEYTTKMQEYIGTNQPQPNEANVVGNSRPSYTQPIRDIFMTIDSFGNYSQCEWFFNLNQNRLRKFIYELKDIWFYRAQIPSSTRASIYPPTGNPFFDIGNNISVDRPIHYFHEKCFNIMNRLINTSTDVEYRKLGALYILTALTIVSPDAASAMPWLFYSTQ